MSSALPPHAAARLASPQEGAIDTLVGIYCRLRNKLRGPINEHGKLHMGRLEILLQELGRVEDKVGRPCRAWPLSHFPSIFWLQLSGLTDTSCACRRCAGSE